MKNFLRYNLFFVTLQREFLLGFRQGIECLQPLIFFVIVTSLFPLAISNEAELLQNIAPGLIWICALLATLLSLDRLFKQDEADGTLEQLLISPHSTYLAIISKLIAYWLIYCIPLIVLAPVMALALQLDPSIIPTLLLALVLGTPSICLLGALGAALTLTLRNNNILMGLLILPLCIPILIFGSHLLVIANEQGIDRGLIWLLAAILVLALTLIPLAIHAALKISIDY